MPDFDILVGAMMWENIVLELPGPCRGDLRGFSKNFRIICLHKIIKNGLNRVEVRDLGLILWENDATPLISIFRPVMDQKIHTTNFKKFQSMPGQPWAYPQEGNYLLTFGSLSSWNDTASAVDSSASAPPLRAPKYTK